MLLMLNATQFTPCSYMHQQTPLPLIEQANRRGCLTLFMNVVQTSSSGLLVQAGVSGLHLWPTNACVQGASPQHIGQVPRCGDEEDWHLSSAANGQIQLHQVCLHFGTILPELRERDKCRGMPQLPVPRAL